MIYSFDEILKECWSKEDYDKYFPEDFNPIERDGGINHEDWALPRNPDDDDSAISDWFENEYLPKHYDFTEKENKDLGRIIANAFWAGNTVGHKNGVSSN